MCGRFVSATPPDELARYFEVGAVADTVSRQPPDPDWNVAPTREIYVVHDQAGVRTLTTMRWGLVPSWAEDTRIGNRLINARAETLATKPAFRSAFRRRRCLVPADGFYEWRSVEGQKARQPYYVHRTDGEPMAMAGLWERQGDLVTCTVVTGPANATMAPLHDRMPVLVAPADWGLWLDRGVEDVDLVGGLLVPPPAELITFHPVATEVNNPRHGGPHLIDPLPTDPARTGTRNGGAR